MHICEWMADQAFKISSNIIKYRAMSHERSRSYGARLMFDGFAAKDEDRLIQYANRIIEWKSRGVDYRS